MKKFTLRAISVLLVLLFAAAISEAKARSGEVTFDIKVEAPESSKDVRLWIPYPMSDNDQTIEDVKIAGNYSYSGIYREKETGAVALYAEWTKPSSERVMTVSFKASALERVKKDFPLTESDMPVDVKPYLEGSKFLPVDGKVKEVADSIVKGKTTVKERARAVYDWVVENTFRDPDIKGCGTGDVDRVLAEKSGKCADISSVYVALARAAGVPSREVFGLRLGKKAEEDMTGGHHCWAEFYLPGYGWVPVDPADVRKAMLVEKLELKDAGKYREYYYGAVDEYRIALARGGRGYYLSPPQKDGPINYFMYPYAEVDGKALDYLSQKELKYKVTFRETR